LSCSLWIAASLKESCSSRAISRAMPTSRASCGSLPEVQAEPMMAGTLAARAASRIRRRSRLYAESEKSVSPEPS
jgi:hypothetical protein